MNTMNEMAEAKANLIRILEIEKRRLIEAIGVQMTEGDECKTSAHGACGRIGGLPGILYVNCTRKGIPNARVGHGVNRLTHYFWIPAIYRDAGLERSYTLSLCREDLDARTGNIHTDFTQLQMTRLNNNGPEVGGQANPLPSRIEGGWRLDYLADESFPRAVRCCTGATVDTDEKPWGHDGFEKKIPMLDMADPAYNPDAVAAFFLALVAHDVRERNDGD